MIQKPVSVGTGSIGPNAQMKDYWHKGYCTEAMKAIIEFVYRKPGIKKICSDHAVDNPRSGKAMEKCGLKFAVIISQSNGKWVFCKHKERDTYEAPGGHREIGEDILETAKRELQEETGATRFDIKPICVYSVTGKNSVNET